MSIQVIAKSVGAGRLHLTHLATCAHADHVGITDDVALIATAHIQRRPGFEGSNVPSMTLRKLGAMAVRHRLTQFSVRIS